MVQGRLRGDLRVSKRSSKGVKRELRQVQRCFEEASRVFQEFFNEVLFDKFFVAWISSQLPEQKEGLFRQISAHRSFNIFWNR